MLTPAEALPQLPSWSASKTIAMMELERILLPARAAGRTEASRSSWTRVLGSLASLVEGRVSVDDGREALSISARSWRSCDLFELDCAIARALDDGTRALRVVGDDLAPPDLARACREVLVRYQRFVPRRNAMSATAVFDRVLARHRELHDLAKPLVRADFEHANDTWQWVLRLDPRASAALQVAALFHDIERLESESIARVEQHAEDYAAFKAAHAKRGAALVRRALAGILGEGMLARVAALIAAHDRVGEHSVLEDADALSFFSVNVCGFLRYYGEAHTRKKIAFTIRRLSPRGRRALATIKLRADVASLVEEARWTSSSSV